MNLDKQLGILSEKLKAARKLLRKIRKEAIGNGRSSLRQDLEYIEDDLRYSIDEVETLLL